MRVLHVKKDGDRRRGGSVTAMVGAARVTTIAGDQASLVVLRRSGDDHSLLYDVRDRHGVRLLFVPRSRISPFGVSIHFVRKFRRIVAQYDLVEIHEIYSFPALIACWMARRHGVPYAIHPHNSLDPYDLQKKKLLKKALRPAVRRLVLGASTLWFATRDERDRSDDHGASVRKVVTPLSVPEPDFIGSRRNFRDQLGLDDGDFVFLFAGRFDPKKGLLRTIRAFDTLAERHLKLVIAGSGDDDHTAEIRAQIDRCALPERIILPGFLIDQSLSDAYTGSDLFILHSDNENFGLTPVEAAFHGLPAILSEDVFVGPSLAAIGCAEIVQTTEDALSLAMAALSHDPKRLAKLREACSAVRDEFGDTSAAIIDRSVRVSLTSPEIQGSLRID